MNADCLFCKIANHDIPSDIVYEDERVVAFNDINPQAPVHSLIIPRKHISTINDIETADESLVGYLVSVAKNLAKENDLSEPGYRIVMNCNQQGGQTVFHIHLHLLGGRQLTHLG
ncbi:MAG TPA: histidine triad nucleotide-binding protein [Pseudomonadales bacterium]|jgi:histidine triad (HIT) family protein|nr:histidine triad nucleotide-binding protein [Pseudomonadales bacterium]MDP6315985.1 histidine triad nucleotide-binding protein [Pseudomonadales bacterium]MDP7313205.1 histidine triad nucleotide-binding protein [Pseudomonadales bacterium]MDP7577179.1 histidine triad nucleotide-binding protein [Pseudomonadales bacterium]HJL61186.1 histidine triad nucleotide-binding protein [Pseudomonadales bacterium]|tara:strand:+ start:1078 stop:1422 length:345 start_codon:yes stop_codon:yes gene_type:complete